MDQTIWGKVFWDFLHGLIEVADDTYARKGCLAFVFNSLAVLLPCKKCRCNYLVSLEKTPFPATNDRAEMQRWLIDMHNTVNAELGKKQLSYREAYAYIRTIKSPLRLLPLVWGVMHYNIERNMIERPMRAVMRNTLVGFERNLMCVLSECKSTSAGLRALFTQTLARHVNWDKIDQMKIRKTWKPDKTITREKVHCLI